MAASFYSRCHWENAELIDATAHPEEETDYRNHKKQIQTYSDSSGNTLVTWQQGTKVWFNR